MASIELDNGFVPKYMQIRDHLINKIRSGELRQGEIIPSEWELAKMFNVSRITAVKAVKELETQGLVIREQGRGTFVSDNVPLGIPVSATHNIGLVVSDLSYVGLPYLNRILRGINQKLNINGYNLVLYGLTGNNESKVFSVENVISKKQVDGLIVDEATPEIMKFLCEQDLPFVQIGRCLENEDGLRYSSVTVDYYAGILKGLKSLVERGRKSLAFLCDTDRPELVKMWTRFYTDALEEVGLPFNQDYLCIGPYGEESGREMIKQLFERKLPLDGMLATDDIVATGALKELTKMGIEVPREIALIGFGNFFLDSELTTLEPYYYEMGSKAADDILERLSLLSTPAKKGELLEEVIEPELIIRRT